MNDPQSNFESWRQQAWQGKLSPAEQTELDNWLGAHPEARAEWELEQALNGALETLPKAPVPSNFTARVLAAVEREARTAPARTSTWLSWRMWLPRVAAASLLLTVGLFTYQQVQQTRRANLLHGVATVAEVASLPSPQILEDFDAIMVLNQTPPADEQLLTLFE